MAILLNRDSQPVIPKPLGACDGTAGGLCDSDKPSVHSRVKAALCQHQILQTLQIRQLQYVKLHKRHSKICQLIFDKFLP